MVVTVAMAVAVVAAPREAAADIEPYCSEAGLVVAVEAEVGVEGAVAGAVE